MTAKPSPADKATVIARNLTRTLVCDTYPQARADALAEDITTDLVAAGLIVDPDAVKRLGRKLDLLRGIATASASGLVDMLEEIDNLATALAALQAGEAR